MTGNLFDILEWLFEFTIRKSEESKEMVQSGAVMSRLLPGEYQAMGFEIGYRPAHGKPKKKKFDSSGSQNGSGYGAVCKTLRRRNWMLCCSLRLHPLILAVRFYL